MLNNPYIRLCIWILATGFFFMASFVLIVEFGPPPTETEAMRFMQGMMRAMMQSLMGLSMSLEHDPLLKSLVALSAGITVPLVSIGLLFGLLLKTKSRR